MPTSQNGRDYLPTLSNLHLNWINSAGAYLRPRTFKKERRRNAITSGTILDRSKGRVSSVNPEEEDEGNSEWA